MDAKPQRPRVLRVRDENLPPVDVGPMKTIHQRNKSTPALSTLLQPLGGARTGFKRTAFADVSNTAGARGVLQTAKDDSSLPKKISLVNQPLRTTFDASKENASVLESLKPAPLLRPAQRPLSLTAAKVAVANATAPSAPTLPVVTANKQNIEPKPREETKPAKTLTKKQTIIFNDASSVPAAEALHAVKPLPELPQALQSDKVTVDAAQQKPSDNVSLANPILEGVALPASEVLPSIMEEPPAVPALDTNDFQLPALLSTADIGLDEVIQVPQSYADLLPVTQPEEPYTKLDLPASLETLLELAQPTAPFEKVSEMEVKPQSTLLPPGEPEEIWDEEEEDEYFDADGYTTARSIRSRGDTTGGMTTLMEPRTTARVERELAAAKQYVDAMKTPEDIEDEAWDTSMVAEYGDDIFEYMRSLEQRMKPNPHYMDNQTEIQWSMRAVLMDWLVQVHHRFTLLPETLFLAINYVDRFLSCKVVSLGKLQLVGATAIFVAAKYEEINCPSVQEIIYMVDGGYTMDEILKAERFMLSMLQFELGWPGPMSFLRRISKADDYDLETRTLAKYFLEVTVMDERFVGCAPSFTAAGAHCLARLMLRKGDWGLAHVHYSQFTYQQIHSLVQTILECCEDPRKHHAAVFDKYSDKRFKRASLYVETEIGKGFQLPLPSRESNGYSQSFRRKG